MTPITDDNLTKILKKYSPTVDDYIAPSRHDPGAYAYGDTVSIPIKNATSTQLETLYSHARWDWVDHAIPYKNIDSTRKIHEQVRLNFIKKTVKALPPENTRGNVTQLQNLNTQIDNYLAETLGTPKQLQTVLNAHIEKHADMDVINAVRKIIPKPKVSHILRGCYNKSVLLEMAGNPANKIPLYLLLHVDLKELRIPNKINHPGELITLLKKIYQIDNANWKYFLKMSPAVLNGTVQEVQVLANIKKNKTSPALSKFINTTYVGRELTRLHAAIKKCEVDIIDDSCTDCAKNTKSLQNLYSICACTYDLKLKDLTKTYGDAISEFTDIVDYITNYHRDNDNTYPYHGTWNNLVKASESYHYEIVRQRAIRRTNNTLHEWNTLLPAFEMDEYDITPLTEHAHLIAEGERMSHCVGSYWEDALNRNYRLFHIEKRENRRDAGTLCLAPDNTNNYKVSQLRSYHNGTCSKEIQHIATVTANRYNRKFHNVSPELRIWSRSTNMTTQEVTTTGFPERDILLAELAEDDQE